MPHEVVGGLTSATGSVGSRALPARVAKCGSPLRSYAGDQTSALIAFTGNDLLLFHLDLRLLQLVHLLADHFHLL